MKRTTILTLMLSALSLGALGCADTSVYWADTPPLIAPTFTAPVDPPTLSEQVAVADDAKRP